MSIMIHRHLRLLISNDFYIFQNITEFVEIIQNKRAIKTIQRAFFCDILTIQTLTAKTNMSLN